MTGNAPVSDSMCRGVRVPGSRRGGRGPVANAGWASVDAGACVLRGEGVVAPEVTAPRRTICPLWIYKLWVEGEDDPVAAFRAVRADRSRDLVEIDDRREKGHAVRSDQLSGQGGLRGRPRPALLEHRPGEFAGAAR